MTTKRRETREDLFKSLAASLLVCVPSFFLAIYAMENNVHWNHPGFVTLAVLGLGAANFTMIVVLDYYRDRIGPYTIPALLGGMGVVLLFVLLEAVNRFVMPVSYEWLYPIVAAYLMLGGFAIFREKMLALKLHIGVNTIALAVLWSLGAADKIALPF